MRSLLWLIAAAVTVYAMTQINAVLGTGGPVVVSSIPELFGAFRGFGAFLVLLALLTVCAFGLRQSVRAR
ncbi:hypothetical protein A3J33_00615 [candidate division WWE3 bacterium RIFCSPLOWO2_02_FULL_53_10]|uniref:Uncharacterized protein n=2 Tax=Katanobacteria TaxID=422282 RepID=A0A1F4WND5_UNCKA|nr:MAG: hypothetical protein A2890_00355 [candidate division WWE3 bacterium RIFCSPLOWO2_01_FULL_53_14]OGC70945.1 MAG: hypothetical protein A3J33_00615 [candidate division WWE3 bacterium RIFCSPLOWO2_02_FULL_53_10]